MDKRYKDLMAQQDIRAEATAQFYEKMEKTGTRRRPIAWKIALAAACLALMIPLTAFAVEYMFGTPKVKLGKLDWHESPNGYSVRFDNLDSFPVDAFPEEVQTLAENKRVRCDSWEAAEEALGIDLLNNTFLAKANKITMKYDDLGSVHSYILYAQREGQLYYVSTGASYRYNRLQMNLVAKLTVEHPKLDEETKRMLLSVEAVPIEPADVELSYEEYTTAEGIPVVILRLDRGFAIEYKAVFAVNDISYELNAYAVREREASEKQILLDALEGFELN